MIKHLFIILLFMGFNLYAETALEVRLIIEENAGTIERDYPVSGNGNHFGDIIKSRVYIGSNRNEHNIDNPGIFCTGSLERRGEVLHASGKLVITKYRYSYYNEDGQGLLLPTKSTGTISYDIDLMMGQKVMISGMMMYMDGKTPTLLNIDSNSNHQYDAKYYLMLIPINQKQGAQQVDSAGASTNAVPPSNPSGSPR